MYCKHSKLEGTYSSRPTLCYGDGCRMSSEEQQPASSILLAKLYFKETADKSDDAK